ncbi:MAG: substrate-binding domain-containing protein [Kiritimatiellae bacterium]|nr:substrate-binding domain-containing protein [Kiritimatiellia bacterium]
MVAFVREAIAYLAQRGRRRILFFRTFGDALPAHDTRGEQLDCAMDKVRELDLMPLRLADAVVTQDVQGPVYEQLVLETAEATIRDWMRLPAAERPDAMLVNDDIAMRAVSLALIKAGVRVPEDVLVVSQASEGIDLHYGVPVVRYEFSPRAMAHALVELLWKRILGESDPDLPITIGGRIREAGA